jgi:hypothetical protein
MNQDKTVILHCFQVHCYIELRLNQGRGYYFTTGGELPMDYQKD